MSVKIRTTEQHPHPIWDKFTGEFPIAEIQGFIFDSNDDELISATKSGSKTIPVQCIEAAEYESDDELVSSSFFSFDEWVNKINTAAFFQSSLLFLTHKKNDAVLFRLFEVSNENGNILFSEKASFINEIEFICWWKSIKKLKQIKKTVEARPRQNETVFDQIIEKYGSAWGGNMDGFLLNDKTNLVKAIIEVRQSRTFEIEKYDPASYFQGTSSKGGDFKTWLPLIYLKKAFNLPVILITFSTKSGSRFGYSEVSSINRTRLFYVNDIPPTANITEDFDVFKKWVLEVVARY